VVRPLAVTAIPLFLVAAGCGSGDDAAANTAPVVSTAAPTTLVVPDGGDRCEDTPDPADYEGPVPTARRPCELPTEVTTTPVIEGSGREAAAGDGVIYHATKIDAEDGSLITSTWPTGQPANFPIIGQNPADPLDEALVGAQAGAILRVDVPADATGGEGLLGPDATDPSATSEPSTSEPSTSEAIAERAVSYVVEVLAVIPALTAEDAPRAIDIPPSEGATELGIVDVEVGDGKVVEEGDTVIVAMLLLRGDNEVVLLDSWFQGQPLVIQLRPELMAGPEPATMPGMFEGLQGARVGGRRILTIPPAMAYGEGGRPLLGLPPNTDVIVVADVLGAF
jgi:FKBP-type peptidyl-prolyl cis-trans isomerase